MTQGTRPIALHPARPEDATDIADIWYSGWQDGHLGYVSEELIQIRTEESFHKRAAERIGDTTVAIVNEEIAGFMMVVDDEVEQVFVAARHRGTGVADALMTEAERQVKANGHSKAWLAVVAGNARARAFYERSGWVDEGLFDYAAATEDGTISVPCRRYTKTV